MLEATETGAAGLIAAPSIRVHGMGSNVTPEYRDVGA